MSENATPRTDAASFYGAYVRKGEAAVDAEFARKLERELSAANARIAGLEKDAGAWRMLEEQITTYMYEPLYNARTGIQIEDSVRWVLYWDGPRKSTVWDAINAALAAMSAKDTP